MRFVSELCDKLTVYENLMLVGSSMGLALLLVDQFPEIIK